MMKMEGWKDHLHFAFLGEHVLFPNLHIDSLAKFAVASFVAIFVCLTERLLTYGISKHWGPARIRHSRLRTALWRAGLYWLVTFDRLMYMLIAMTFNIELIVVTVTTLSFGQFIIEYLESASLTRSPDPETLKEPLLSSSHFYSLSSPGSPPSPSHSHSHSRSSTSSLPRKHERQSSYPPPPHTTYEPHPPASRRTRSKPDNLNLYIHPSESNIARADAAAHELGLTSGSDEGEGERHRGEPQWELGKGPDVARELLGRY